MAVSQKVLITMICDRPHEEDDADDTDAVDDVTTVAYGIDGKSYEIDLCRRHNSEFREAMAEVAPYARPVAHTGRHASASRRSRSADQPNSTDVREWAKTQGIEVKDRGRVPVDIVKQYQEANA